MHLDYRPLKCLYETPCCVDICVGPFESVLVTLSGFGDPGDAGEGFGGEGGGEIINPGETF